MTSAMLFAHRCAVLPTLLVQAAAGAWAADGAAAAGADAVRVVKKAEAQWHPGPSAFPAGLELTVLHGDPTQAGPFAVRLRAPAGYRFPLHVHGGDEQVTLIEGDLSLGVGKTFETSALRPLAVGDFASIPANAPHFAMTTGGTIIQVHGVGPLSITCFDEHPAHAK